MFDPEDGKSVRRLRDAMRCSAQALRPWREEYIALKKRYAGSHYGGNQGGQKTPTNLLQLALRIYQRQLISGQPRAIVTTNYQGAKLEAYEFQLALNHMLLMMDIRSTLQIVVKEALFRMGILKVGITPVEMPNATSWSTDAGMPYADPVLFEDWLHDTTAHRLEEMSWCGNRYRVRLDALRESPLFDPELVSGLKPKDGGSTGIDDLGGGAGSDSNQKSNLMSGNRVFDEEYTDYVTLWDIWLPFEQLVVTLCDDDSQKPLRIVEWDGPRRGPYHVLAFDILPGNVVPVSQGQSLADVHDLINSLYRKMGRQAERQKTVTFASGISASDGTSQAIIDAADGETVRCDDPRAVQEFRMGGVDQATLGFSQVLQNVFSYLGGNLDSLGGLGRMADTVGQEEIISRSSNTLVSEMQNTTVEFVKAVTTSIGFYMWSDPTLIMDLTKPLPMLGGATGKLPFRWGPWSRTESWYRFIMDVEPYSLRSRGPGERLQTLMQVVTQVLMPMQPFMQQKGGGINVEELLRVIARYGDMDELPDIVEFSGAPIDQGPGIGVSSSGGSAPTMPAQTERTYVRKSVSAGPSQPNQQMQLAQALMSGRGVPMQGSAA